MQPSTPAPPTQAERQPVAWDPALIERLRKELAVYLGPMAKMIVGRASSKARSLGELYDSLAGEIPAPKDREHFRKSLATISSRS